MGLFRNFCELICYAYKIGPKIGTTEKRKSETDFVR